MDDTKYGKYISSADVKVINPKKAVPSLGIMVDSDSWAGIGDIPCNFAFVSISEASVMPDPPHSHDFDEVIGFAGTNRNYPRDLCGEIEFLMGGEKHTITKTCLIFVPKGVDHCPVKFVRVDTPIFMFEAANDPEYTKNM